MLDDISNTLRNMESRNERETRGYDELKHRGDDIFRQRNEYQDRAKALGGAFSNQGYETNDLVPLLNQKRSSLLAYEWTNFTQPLNRTVSLFQALQRRNFNLKHEEIYKDLLQIRPMLNDMSKLLDPFSYSTTASESLKVLITELIPATVSEAYAEKESSPGCCIS